MQFTLKQLFSFALIFAVFLAGRASVRDQHAGEPANLRVPVNLRYSNTSVRDALLDLGRQANLSVKFDNRGLGTAASQLDRLITADLGKERISLASALTLMLNPAELGYYVRNRSVIITSYDAADSWFERHHERNRGVMCGLK